MNERTNERTNETTKLPALPDGEIHTILRSFVSLVLTHYQRTTDRQAWS